MDQNKEQQIKEYIDSNEQTKWFWKLAETVVDLAWVEKETKEWFLSRWLKNNESLLTYAELVMKTEDLNTWERIRLKLLEIKLSIPFVCPYFDDFKDFLEELKRWPDTSENGTGTQSFEWASESSETSTHQFCWSNLSNIKSEPFEKNSKTWVTWCSKTARNNWKNFGIILPAWDAYVAGATPWKDSIQTIPSDKVNDQPEITRNWIEASTLKSLTRWNYADIYTDSKSSYGHRAAAFKDDSWEWYVLDPYTRVNWRLDSYPKKLEDYLKVRKIVKAHIYESNWYLPDGQEVAANPKVENAVNWAIGVAEDNIHWYEWWWKWKNWQYDCSGLVNAAFKQAGFNINNRYWTQSMREEYTALWFEWISPYDPNNLKRWDILLKDQWADGERHTEIYTGNWKFVWARSNKDKKSWDSSWDEISESSANWLKTFGWNWILRYKW